MNGLSLSFDVNYRRKLWSAESARTALERVLPFVDLLITGAADSAEVFQVGGMPVEIASEMRQRYGIPAVIVTASVAGAAAASESGVSAAPAIAATEVDRVGAGDAFAAGAIDGFLDGDLERGIRLGCAMAALKRTIPGDMLSATREEIDRVLASGSTAIRR
jgi:2-dehydro-3-deoxygluconokinase